ncbi:3949_t:CDS:2, partial [Funneliformis caledonium]
MFQLYSVNLPFPNLMFNSLSDEYIVGEIDYASGTSSELAKDKVVEVLINDIQPDAFR